MNKPKHSTLTEVAKKAGVGTTTVSRVINGGLKVDPRTMARVQRAIRALGYMPNQAARSLRGDRTRLIGFVVPSIADPFFSSCAEVVQAIAHANDSLLIVLTTRNDPKIEMDAVQVLMRHRTDGFIIAPANSDSKPLRELLGRLSVPIVAMDRPVAKSMIPSVVTDNFAGAKLATQHLIGHGYTRIACITGEPELYTIQERMRGYRSAIKAAGLQPLIDISVQDHDSAEQALKRMFSAKDAPEAIFTLKNSATVDIFEMLQKQGIAIPETVALLGYDDFQLAETVRPSITVIQQPIDQIGRVSAEILFQQLLGNEAAKVGSTAEVRREVKLKVRLIERGSCGCVPGGV